MPFSVIETGQRQSCMPSFRIWMARGGAGVIRGGFGGGGAAIRTGSIATGLAAPISGDSDGFEKARTDKLFNFKAAI